MGLETALLGAVIVGTMVGGQGRQELCRWQIEKMPYRLVLLDRELGVRQDLYRTFDGQFWVYAVDRKWHNVEEYLAACKQNK